MPDAQVGQRISVGLTVKDSTGAAANTGTLPTAVITQPDATTATATAVNTATGSYTVTSDAVVTQAGRYMVTSSASGANSAGFPYTDYVNVWPADPRFLISLAVARDALNLTTGNTVHDEELRLYIAAATDVIEDITGPILRASEVRTFDAYEPALFLPDQPSTITSVVEKGVTLTENTDFIVDYNAGILYRVLSDGSPRAWGSYYQPTFIERGSVVVTYTAGSGVVPPAILLAAAEEVRFLYQVGQQGSRPAWGQEPSEMAWTPSGFAVPRRVYELCAPLAGQQRFLGTF